MVDIKKSDDKAGVVLRCQSYSIQREPCAPIIVEVCFILAKRWNKSKEIAEALKKLELYLANDINLVKDDDGNRCYYCSTLNEESEKSCTQCGAPL